MASGRKWCGRALRFGLLPSASLGARHGLYEPVHGTALDIAGKDIASPIATIASVAMMFRYSFKMENEARAIENMLARGYRTQDVSPKVRSW